MKDAVEGDKQFPLKQKDGKMEITSLDLKRKISAAIEISRAKSCVVVFINTDNLNDKIVISTNDVVSTDWEKVENFVKLFVKFLVIKNVQIN